MASIYERLAAPFPADLVSWRVGSTTQDKSKGMALAYIDARDVMNRLDEVVGPENWQCRYPHADKKTVCEIDIWVEGRGWVTKADGAGDTDVEAEKGSLSDSFKRCAVKWGVGRYLYDFKTPWVPLVAAGRSYKITDAGMATLRRVVAGERVSTEAPEEPPSAKRAPPPKIHGVVSGAVLAACVAIDLCADEDTLTSWGEANSHAIKGMDADEAAAVRQQYGKRLMALRGEGREAA